MRLILLLAVMMGLRAEVRQGDVIRVAGPGESARMNGRTVRLYGQADGSRLGLMPVPAAEKPGDYALEVLDASGKVVRSGDVEVKDARFRRQNVLIAKQTAALAASEEETRLVRAFLQAETEGRYWADPLGLPLAGCMISPYGVQRFHNGIPTGNVHGGWDQRGGKGTAVRAAAAGVVRIAKMFELRGGTVGIDHGQGLETMYLHMSGFAVQEGAEVKEGEVVGYVGSTGRSTGPHLHWSILANGVAVNPAQWVKVKACAAQAAAGKKK
ncbi:MAG: M23 family metallopeptidase [Candidatus Solibacter usitatus]|nr:M23 family metallopeptidase [Candidatus Solibacter usitatus]